MARQDTLWERFLSPIVRSFINEEELQRYYNSVDWEQEGAAFQSPNIKIPDYYSSQNFHGIKGGYLTAGAAVSYDPITQYVLPPGENLVRQFLVDSLQSKPKRILDLGCGTGSTTLMLKQAFASAEVVGLDLSPYMLVRASHKAKEAGLDIQWVQGNAEQTGFKDASFDLVTASLLFHETPNSVSQTILHECFRLLPAGGEVAILDGNQQTIRNLEWLSNIFEEPYIKDYAAASLDNWMNKAGFAAVQTLDYWFIHQVTRAVKPLAQTTEYAVDAAWIPAPGY